ncbi:MAG TPA: FecR domain-containing protein [Myxococcales bacterium]
MVHRKGEIERYLTDGLGPSAETDLRAHLRECAQCRTHYDQQVALLRALAGHPMGPTAREDRRVERLGLAAPDLVAPSAPPPPRAAWWRAIPPLYWRLGAAGATCLLLIAVAFGLARGPVRSATVVKAQGLTVSGKPAAVGSTILSGEPLVIRAGGYAELAIDLGGTLRLFPKSAARLEEGGTGVELSSGKVWCQVDPGAPTKAAARFRAVTDRGEARVLGTSFFVEKLPAGEMEVRVLSGKVAVEDAGHAGTLELRAGQKTRIDRGAPLPAQAYSGEDAEEWDLEGFFKQLGRGLKSTFSK